MVSASQIFCANSMAFFEISITKNCHLQGRPVALEAGEAEACDSLVDEGGETEVSPPASSPSAAPSSAPAGAPAEVTLVQVALS